VNKKRCKIKKVKTAFLFKKMKNVKKRFYTYALWMTPNAASVPASSPRFPVQPSTGHKRRYTDGKNLALFQPHSCPNMHTSTTSLSTSLMKHAQTILSTTYQLITL